MTTQLVFVQNGQALTTSKVIAQGVEIEHESIMRTLKQYQADFETFGIFRFEIGKINGGRGRPETYALLNEQQATLLVTYCKNTEVVRKFKVALVKAFYEARQSQLTAPDGNTITYAQQEAIKEKVAERAKRSAANYQTIYKALRIRFQVRRFELIPRDKFIEALNFIRDVELKAPVVQQPKPDAYLFSYDPRTLSADELRAISNLIYLRELGKPTFEQVYNGLRGLNSQLAPRFYSLIHESEISAITVKDVLHRNKVDFTSPN